MRSLTAAIQAVLDDPMSIPTRSSLASAVSIYSVEQADAIRRAALQMAASRGLFFTALALGKMYLKGGELAQFVSEQASRFSKVQSNQMERPSTVDDAIQTKVQEIPKSLDEQRLLAYTLGTYVDPSMCIPNEELPPLPILSALTPIEFVVLALEMEALSIRAGQTCIRQGEEESAVYILSHGEVDIFQKRADGEEVFLSSVHAPAILGEMSLLTHVPRRATVTAKTPCLLWKIDAPLLERLSQVHSSLHETLHSMLKERLLSNISRLSRVLQSLPDEQRTSLLNSFQLQHIPAQTHIVQKGTESLGLYILLHGEAEVWTDAQTKRRTATLSEGDVFGEISTLTGELTTAEIVLPEGGVVLHIPQDAYSALAQKYPKLVSALQTLKEGRMHVVQEMIQAVTQDFDELDATWIVEDYLEDFDALERPE